MNKQPRYVVFSSWMDRLQYLTATKPYHVWENDQTNAKTFTLKQAIAITRPLNQEARRHQALIRYGYTQVK